jgi:hypothetical protein
MKGLFQAFLVTSPCLAAIWLNRIPDRTLMWPLACLVVIAFGTIAWARVPLRPFPWMLILPALALLAAGWCSFSNPRAIFDPETWEFGRLPKYNPALPSTVDAFITREEMLSITSVLAWLVAIRIYCTSSSRRIRVWTILVVTSALLAGIGIVEKLADVSLFFPAEKLKGRTTNFASFYYHGNAGSFLLILIPLACARALAALRKREPGWIIGVFIGCALILSAAAMINVSKAAQVLTAVLLLICVIAYGWPILRQASGRSTLNLVLSSVLAIGGFALVIYFATHSQSAARWAEVLRFKDLAEYRLIVDKAAISAAPDAGRWGFGPGTFHAIFPAYTREVVSNIPGFWRNAHNDYLQTLLEWGSIGSGLWALLGVTCAIGALRIVAFPSKTDPNERQSTRRLLAGAAMLGLTFAMLHALVDFPWQHRATRFLITLVMGLAASSAIQTSRRAGERLSGKAERSGDPTPQL